MTKTNNQDLASEIRLNNFLRDRQTDWRMHMPHKNVPSHAYSLTLGRNALETVGNGTKEQTGNEVNGVTLVKYIKFLTYNPRLGDFVRSNYQRKRATDWTKRF